MDRATFEQLLSEWLDQPDCAELGARVEAAIQEQADFARVRDEWLRLGQLLGRFARTAPNNVDWQRLRQRIGAEIELTAASSPAPLMADALDSAEALDAILRRGLPDIEARVDWPRFGRRVRTAAQAAGPTARTLRFPRRRVAAVAGLLAVAAALVFLLRLSWRAEQPPVLRPVPAGIAQVVIHAATEPTVPPGRAAIAEALVRIEAPQPVELPNPAHDAPPRVAAAAPEVFMIVSVAPAARVESAPADDMGY